MPATQSPTWVGAYIAPYYIRLSCESYLSNLPLTRPLSALQLRRPNSFRKEGLTMGFKPPNIPCLLLRLPLLLLLLAPLQLLPECRTLPPQHRVEVAPGGRTWSC